MKRPIVVTIAAGIVATFTAAVVTLLVASAGFATPASRDTVIAAWFAGGAGFLALASVLVVRMNIRTRRAVALVSNARLTASLI